jgi:hypothetical protein
MQPKKRLNVQIPAQLRERLDLECGLSGKGQSEIVAIALNEWLNGREFSRECRERKKTT